MPWRSPPAGQHPRPRKRDSRSREAARHYQKLKEDQVQLIDIFESVGEEYLKLDGIHLESTGYEAWHEVLVAYAAENNIPE